MPPQYSGAVQQVEVSRHIAGSPREVWEVYTDHASWAEWSGVRAARIAREGDPAPNGSGCVRVLGPGPFAAHEEILDFEPPGSTEPGRMTYRIVGGRVPLRDHFGEVLFTPEGEGTRIVWRCRFESKLPGLGGLLRGVITRLFSGVLDGLAEKRFPEGGSYATTRSPDA
jgi:uncharacterized protein YndB with AHSA1/START domain